MGYDDYQERKEIPENGVIIVCDKAHEKYANYLHQLVSTKDDTRTDVLGVRDGEVTSAVWPEKVYVDSKPELPSTARVVFIGHGGRIKKETDNIPNKFYKYGMIYGWLGSKAVLKVSDWLHSGLYTPADYKRLIEYAQEQRDRLGMRSQGNELAVLSKLDAFGESLRNVLQVKNLQYYCLMDVFYLEGFTHFLEG